jgi:nicotinate phosphoribosyltransferase
MKLAEKQIAEGILYTDQYQLTMAQVYFRMGLHERRAQFDHFFRDYPHYDDHQAGHCINAGLEWLLDWMARAHFGDEELNYLRSQQGPAGKPTFDEDFLAWLGENGTFDGITMRAIPEGRVVHQGVPLTVVEGPLAMAQILETSLLNHLNYPVLVATKACRVRESGRRQPLLEFGLRRAQELGANAGARAALIGGADFTSNVGASYATGYPPKGTHAHSLVQVFTALGGSEIDAFRAYAEVYPDNCLLLVDTIDTLESGVPNAIKVFEELRRQGHEPVGIRLDSGDLAHLAVMSARMLNEAGFDRVSIVLSNKLDEMVIMQILNQIELEARQYGLDPEALIGRLVYGVGTRLITSAGAGALDGVYKLVALEKDGAWEPAIKLSESPAKVPNPGHKLSWRVYDRRGRATADLLTLDDENPRTMDPLVLRHPVEQATQRTLAKGEISEIEPLLVDVLLDGKEVYDRPKIEAMRAQRDADLERLDVGVRRLMNPHIYHVSLSERLWALKCELMGEMSPASSAPAGNPAPCFGDAEDVLGTLHSKAGSS